jgi:hypothetical protein
MSASNLIRWAGPANIVGGLLVALGFVLHPPEEAAAVSTGMWVVSHTLLVLSLVIGILGLIGLYARQIQETGALGLIGFLLIFLSMTSFLGITYFEAFINPAVAASDPAFVESQMAGVLPGPLMVILPVSGLCFGLGWLLFGLGLIRAGILPRWAAIVTIIGAIPFGLGPLFPAIVGVIAAVVFGAGAIWLGYALWAEAGEPATQPKPAM